MDSKTNEAIKNALAKSPGDKRAARSPRSPKREEAKKTVKPIAPKHAKTTTGLIESRSSQLFDPSATQKIQPSATILGGKPKGHWLMN